jgi:hypothetical protein
MTSLYTALVARGVEVPEIDPRLISHVEFREVVSTDDRPAASAETSDSSIAPEQASVDQTVASSDDGTTSPLQPLND